MTDHRDAPLFRLGAIAAEITELQTLCETTNHPKALAELARLMHRIGEIQLRLAQAAADTAATAEMEAQFTQGRTRLD